MNIDRCADLHCHSTCSDGMLSAEELITLAAERGFKGLSITDHDTIAAYRNALDIAASKHIRLLPGVECSTSYQGVNVHILGYAFPIPNPSLEEFCNKRRERRKERNVLMLARLEKAGMPIEVDVEEGVVFGRVHMALAMVKKGYVQTVDQAFKGYLGEGKSCYVSLDVPSVDETLDAIHRAGGLAVLAHPHLIASTRVALAVIQKNFDGIEAYYASLPLDQEQRWLDVAEARGLFVTGGSDFHSVKIKPKNFFGASWVGKEIFDTLYNHFLEQMSVS